MTLVEANPTIMRTLDPDMAGRVEAAVRRFGVDVRTACEVSAFEPGIVHTSAGTYRPPTSSSSAWASCRTASWPPTPASTPARRGAIRVDRRQRTSHDGVWAAGDCCESYHLVSRRHVHIALGTVANRQARVAGINIGGGYATFPGVVGTAVTKVCSTEVARTGLTEHEARRPASGYVAATIETTTRAGYFPGAEPIVGEAARRAEDAAGCSAARSSARRARPSASTSSPSRSTPG